MEELLGLKDTLVDNIIKVNARWGGLLAGKWEKLSEGKTTIHLMVRYSFEEG